MVDEDRREGRVRVTDPSSGVGKTDLCRVRVTTEVVGGDDGEVGQRCGGELSRKSS